MTVRSTMTLASLAIALATGITLLAVDTAEARSRGTKSSGSVQSISPAAKGKVSAGGVNPTVIARDRALNRPVNRTGRKTPGGGLSLHDITITKKSDKSSPSLMQKPSPPPAGPVAMPYPNRGQLKR